jgi:D-aminopeptidase
MQSIMCSALWVFGALLAPVAIEGCAGSPPVVNEPETPGLPAPASIQANAAPGAGPAAKCALIDTDDDIPSGSATAGALFVPDAALGKQLLTQDVVATAQGFLDAGLCVIVLDSHDGAIDPAPLETLGVEVWTPANHSPWTWPFFGDAPSHASIAALIGYHSRHDQPSGFRPHTINDNVMVLTFNEVSVGEVTNMIVGYGALDVPVVLVSGDMNATAEAASIVPSVQQVTVRWRDAEGKPAFLTSEQAGQRLRDAARKAASAQHAPYHPTVPLKVAIRGPSKRLMEAWSATLDDAFQQRKHEGHREDHPLVHDFELSSTLKVEGDLASWTAPNGLAAFLSVTVAASHLQGRDNWETVTQGYEAYKAGKYEEAVTAYKRALEVNPLDAATQCRMGTAYQKLEQNTEARRCFREGADNEADIGDSALRSMCWLGLAQTELALKNPAAAKVAAEHVLALPDAFDRHEAARKVLAELGKSPR